MILYKSIKKLHDYIKNNIYDDVQEDYRHIKIRTKDDDPRDDYQMGYDQAVIDFRRNHRFHNYPGSIVKLTNKVSKNKMSEISEFINGYQAGKVHIIDESSR
ncbi:hypothetical protein [Companilactobacillus keshanensis]|uniref:Uncharacterized protein n=1 Tax=Companilactobacillus keshanensis TaxID=2486003 RepID=A0ABW4BTP3_9LACO|nr:hypothetical protein [Companilactobacillus keshanensis]